MRKTIFALLLAVTSTIAIAQTENKKEHINLKDGVAIQGYDPVAYFTAGKPTIGSKDIQMDYKGAVYHFATPENKATFAKNPEQYIPQYGGFCAFGMSEGYEAPVQPEAFTIVDNKLYLNYNLKVRKKWLKTKEERIIKATNNWEELEKER